MTKRLLFSGSLLCLLLPAMGQVSLRPIETARIRAAYEQADLSHKLLDAAVTPQEATLIIKYDSEATLDEIRAKEGKIVSLVGYNTAIVAVSPEKAAEVAGSKGVKGAQLSRKLKRTNDKALSFSNIPDVRQGKNMEKGYDGEGVVIGIFDTGIDPNHINFRDESGETTRIRKFWNYSGSSANPTEYDGPDEISDFSTDSSGESHGSHVLGIMAGSYFEKGNPMASDYRGVAPGAEIVAAGGQGYDAQILDAVERIAKYAKDNGKPCVINLSFGDNLGPHDGSDEFTATINDIAAKYDAVICLAGGNERDTPIAIIKELTSADPYVRTLALKPTSSYDTRAQASGPLEIWTEDDTPFEVSLDVINRQDPEHPLYSLVIPENSDAYVAEGSLINEYVDVTKINLTSRGTAFQELYSSSFMGGTRGVYPNNGRYTAQLNFTLRGRKAADMVDNFVRITVKGKPGKKIFMYCDDYYMTLGNSRVAGIDVPDGAGTNSNMACGKETLAIGSYVSYNRQGSGYQNGTIGATSYFSSYGETLDGRIMPDVCAPGQVIVSSRNSYAATSGDMVAYYPLAYSTKDPATNRTYYWTMCAGTSQASPHVAGVAALMRSANPNLSRHEIYNILRETSNLPTSGNGWGYGKVDAYAAVKKALITEASVYDILDNSPETIMVEGDLRNGLSIWAPGEDSVEVAVYDLNGAEVYRLSSNSDRADLAGGMLTSGMYILHIKAPHSVRTLKLAAN